MARDIWLTVLCGISLAIGFSLDLSGITGETVPVLFYLISYATGGYPGLKETLRDLRNRQINIDFLMIAAAAGAATIGLWLEGAVLLFLFSLSGTLEEYALGRSRTAIHSLMKLRPEQGLVRHEDGREELVAVEELVPGQIVIVKPGENIPVDGEIRSGITRVDQATITGESVPVEKRPGDQVFAATINEIGAIEVEVTRRSQESTLANIINLVEEAQSNKAESQRFLERFEPGYALTVMGAVILLILIPWLLMGQSFEPVFYRAMTVLVVASPCALIISTPASIISAIANAARNGILFKGGTHLEQVARIHTVAFDKTGTLTHGTPVVTDILPVTSQVAALVDEHGSTEGVESDDLLAIAAGCERYSEHHIAEAILTRAREDGVHPEEVENLQAEPGRGISGEWKGSTLAAGNEKLFEDTIGSWPPEILDEADQLKKEGKTVIFIARDGYPLGMIALADQLRPEAARMIRGLRKMGIQKMVMLTGDNQGVADAIAESLDLDDVHAGLLPDEKLQMINNLKKEGVTVMVGDGVNDAPALAVSDLGIAMGAVGTDVALETADVVLMGDDLTKLPYMLWLSRKAKRVVWQNISFSLAVIIVLLTGVFLVDLPLTIGVIGHEGSTLIVVLNGLRLLRTGQLPG